VDVGTGRFAEGDELQKLIQFSEELEKSFGKTIHWRIVTDGTKDLEGVLEILRGLRDANARIVLRLDGPQAVHDRARASRSGHVGHADALRFLERAQSVGVPVDAEAVLTSLYPFPMRVIPYLRDLGCERVATRPVRSSRAGDGNVERFREGYEQLFATLRHAVHSGDASILSLLSEDQAIAPPWHLLPDMTPQALMSRRELIMDPAGVYHVCDRFVGSESRTVGSVSGGIDWNAVDRDPKLEPRSPCRHCWARFACGGACRLTGVYRNYSPASLDRERCRFNEYLVEENLRLIAAAANLDDGLQRLTDGLHAPAPPPAVEAYRKIMRAKPSTADTAARSRP
jgi:uncharacterized protein